MVGFLETCCLAGISVCFHQENIDSAETRACRCSRCPSCSLYIYGNATGTESSRSGCRPRIVDEIWTAAPWKVEG